MGVPDRLTVMKINGKWFVQEWQVESMICAGCAFLDREHKVCCGDHGTMKVFEKQRPSDDYSFCNKKRWKVATKQEALVHLVAHRMEG